MHDKSPYETQRRDVHITLNSRQEQWAKVYCQWSGDRLTPVYAKL
jgi:hypothetical protein